MEFLNEYGIFLAKAVTVLLAILIIIAAASGSAMKSRKSDRKELHVEKLNDKLDDTLKQLEEHILDKDALKKQRKAEKKAAKQAAKSVAVDERKRTYVLSFDGDIKASAVDTFREAVTAVLAVARPEKDEVVVKLESPGGMVHGYGLAAAQLDRIKSRNISLTACVDKVAASGGYMMACVADRIVASPFAIMGSIGVVAQIPNFHRLLKKNDVDVEILTAGEYKRTLTMFGENTEKGRRKFQEDLEDTHVLFKEYVSERRPSVDIEQVATGDIWFGSRALDVNLVDSLQTSDDYLLEACKDADVFSVEVKEKQHLIEKLGATVTASVSRGVEKVLGEWRGSRGLS